jgi:hypothetical protein
MGAAIILLHCNISLAIFRVNPKIGVMLHCTIFNGLSVSAGFSIFTGAHHDHFYR